MSEVAVTVSTAHLSDAASPEAMPLARLTRGTAQVSAARIRARERATEHIAVQLRAFEAQDDLAGIERAKLLQVSLQARLENNFAATFAPDIIDDQIAGMLAWSATRTQTVALHNKLLRLATRLGTRETAVGDGERPEDFMSPMHP